MKESLEELVIIEKNEILKQYNSATNEQLLDLLALNSAYIKILTKKIEKFVGKGI